jgi:hypothetical protein
MSGVRRRRAHCAGQLYMPVPQLLRLSAKGPWGTNRVRSGVSRGDA